MEASRVCQAEKHDKEWESLVPRMLTGKKCMRNWRGLRDRVKIPHAISSKKHLTSGIGYSLKDKNKAKTGQNQARDWKERESQSRRRVRHKWANPTHVNGPRLRLGSKKHKEDSRAEIEWRGEHSQKKHTSKG
ncbi:hypothetical protein Tco_0486998 [Tanacetum coccineum]